MFYFIVMSPYCLSITPTLPPFLPLSQKPPPSPLFPKALPSLSIPQVRHTESHCVSGLGREHTVRPLTMCCRWTHLRRPTNYCTAFSHTHLASLSPFPPPFHHPPPISDSTVRSLFSSARTSTAFLETSHHQQASPRCFFNQCL